jgi:hypothetical protein
VTEDEKFIQREELAGFGYFICADSRDFAAGFLDRILATQDLDGQLEPLLDGFRHIKD